VLICDEQPLVRHVLTRLLVERSAEITVAVRDGFAAADAYTHQSAGVVLIGIHRGSGSGLEALGLVLGLHPAAVVIAFGSAVDAGMLVAAVHRGARGLMLWGPPRAFGPHPDRLSTRPHWSAVLVVG